MLLLTYITFASGLLPIFAAVINYKNLNSTFKIIAAFFLLAFLTDFLAWLYVLKYIIIRNNQPFIHLSILLNVIFYTIIYKRSFDKISLKNITTILGVLALVTITYFIIKVGIWEYPTWENTTLSVYMIILSLLYFHQIFNKQEFAHIEEQPFFWINSGVIIFFSFNIFLYMVFSKLKFQPNLYSIHAITNIITNLLFAIGLFWKPQTRT